MPQILGAIGLAAAGGATGFFATVAGRLLTSVAIGALQYGIAKMQAKASASNGGITTEQTLTGGTNPVFFQMGKYMTAGQMIAPELTHNDDKYLTYVIAVSSLAKTQLSRLMINGAYATVSETSPHADYGKRIVGTYLASSEEITGVDAQGSPVVSDVIDNYAWIKWYDGTQTTADAMMLSKYGSHPTWPWSSDMIGRDMTYAILTFRAKSSIFSSKPTVAFEVLGIPLYDPSKDTTAGGSGTQRWATPSTWAPSNNPMVQAYNLLRGVTIVSGKIYGGQSAASDLPLDIWIEAINKCHLDDGAGSPTYRCGIEVFVDDEPASVLEEIAKSCAAEYADVGGVWEVQVGDPPLAEYFFTDDDVIVTQDQSTSLFDGDLTASVFNAASATYPEPLIGWQRKDSPLVQFADFQAQDLGKPLKASMTFPTVPYPDQVQRLSSIYVKNSRKTRQHQFALPPAAAFLSPMRAVSFTSTENSYSGKLFKISRIADDLLSMVQAVELVEVDPTDYDFDPGDAVPTVPAPITPPATTMPTVLSFVADPYTVLDGSGNPKKPAVRLSWSTSNFSDRITTLEWQVRVNGTTVVSISGSTSAVTLGYVILTDGVTQKVVYQARVRYRTKDGAGGWTAWATVTAPAVKVPTEDLADSFAALLAAGPDNTYPDFDMIDPSFYSTTTGAVYTFNPTGAAKLGQNFLQMAVSADAESVQTRSFAVVADAEYLVTGGAWLAASGAGGGQAVMELQTLSVDSAGVETVVRTIVISNNTDLGLGSIVFPKVTVLFASNERRARMRYRRAVGGGTQAARFGGVVIQQKTGTDLLVYGALAVQGMAAFGGSLQSLNYVPGTSGWMLNQTGTLEIQNLIERDALVDGAVTDRNLIRVSAAQNLPSQNDGTVTFATLALGAIGDESIRLRSVKFEARKNWSGGTVTINFDIRRMESGVWGSWETLSSWSFSTLTTAWDQKVSSGNLAGTYDDVEYRLTASQSNSAAPATNGSGIRNIVILSTDVVK